MALKPGCKSAIIASGPQWPGSQENREKDRGEIGKDSGRAG